MVFDIEPLALGVDPHIGVHAKAIHLAEGLHSALVRIIISDHVGGLGHLAEEIPPAHLVLDARIGRIFQSVEQIGEVDGIPDEEHREVQAHDVQVALIGVEFHGEAAGVPQGVGAALVARHGGEPGKDRGDFARLAEQVGFGVFRHGGSGLEIAESTGAVGVDHPLRDALPVEMGHFFQVIGVL